MYYMGFSWTDAYRLPTAYKSWFIDRLSKQLTKHQEDGSVSRDPAHHTAENRALAQMARTEVPHRHIRFE
jgi:hypothetical protein